MICFFEQLEIQADGSPNGIRFIPATGVSLDAANALPTDVWTHVAVVYRPFAALAKMYINGNEVALTNNGSQPLTSALINSAALFTSAAAVTATPAMKPPYLPSPEAASTAIPSLCRLSPTVF